MGIRYEAPRDFKTNEFFIVAVASFLNGLLLCAPYVELQSAAQKVSPVLVMVLMFALAFETVAVIGLFCHAFKIHTPRSAAIGVGVGMALVVIIKAMMTVSHCFSTVGSCVEYLPQLIINPVYFLSMLAKTSEEISVIGLTGRRTGTSYVNVGFVTIWIAWIVEAISLVFISSHFIKKRTSEPFSEIRSSWIEADKTDYSFKLDDINNIRGLIENDPFEILSYGSFFPGRFDTMPHTCVKLYMTPDKEECYASFFNVRYYRKRRGYSKGKRLIIEYLAVSGDFCDAVRASSVKGLAGGLSFTGGGVFTNRSERDIIRSIIPEGIDIPDHLPGDSFPGSEGYTDRQPSYISQPMQSRGPSYVSQPTYNQPSDDMSQQTYRPQPLHMKKRKSTFEMDSIGGDGMPDVMPEITLGGINDNRSVEEKYLSDIEK